MSRIRALDAVLGQLAVVACILPVTWLFDGNGWVFNGLVTSLLIVALGALLRYLSAPAPAVVAAQVLVWIGAVLALGAGSTLAYGLPTGETLRRFQALVSSAVTVIQTSAAPAPTNEGVTILLIAAYALVSLVVDAIAVTRAAPAASGFALLVVFLAAAANRSTALPWPSFVFAAGAWLALLARQSYGRVDRWSTSGSVRVGIGSSPGSGSGDGRNAFGRMGRWVAFSGLVGALVVPNFLPDTPTRFLAGGLGRSSDGEGGTIGFNSSVDLDRALREGGDGIVLTYRTNAPAPAAIKVVSAIDFTDDQWQGTREIPSATSTSLRPLQPGWGKTTYTFQVESNDLRQPHVAAPQPAASIAVPNGRLLIDPATGDLFTRDRLDHYSVDYIAVAPDRTALATAMPGPGQDRELQLDPRSETLVTEVTNRVTASARTPWEQAVAIQDWLRSDGGFIYSLNPGPRTPGADMVTSFLTTKRGYCTHFATAMVLMARSRGIPARLAMGFLPGTQDRDIWTVRSRDAHAWPELYFEGYGWLRFEPTPGSRSGSVPAYAAPRVTATPTDKETTDRVKPTNSVTEAATPAAVDSGASWWSQILAWFTPRTLVTVFAVGVGIALLFLLFLTELILTRRRRRGPDRAESEWDGLTSALADLGITAPPGHTLRQLERHYAREGLLADDSAAALHRVVATVEARRYAADPPEPARTFVRDAGHVKASVARTRKWSLRLRSWLFPGRARRWWVGQLRSIAGMPGRWVGALRTTRPGQAKKKRKTQSK